MNFSKIRNLSESMNMTIISLAEKTGLTSGGIHGFIKKNDCRVSDLEKISHAFGVNPGIWWDEDIEFDYDLVKVGVPIMNEEVTRYYNKNDIDYLTSQLEEKERYIKRLEKDLAKYENDNNHCQGKTA